MLKITFAILLITGYKTSVAAYGASILTFLFALTTGYSYGQNPLDYNVVVVSTGAFLLGAVSITYKWGLDEFLDNRNQNKT